MPVRLWDSTSGKQIFSLQDTELLAAMFSFDDSRVLIVGGDSLLIHDCTTKRQIRLKVAGAIIALLSTAARDHFLILSVAANKQVSGSLWNTSNFEPLSQFRFTERLEDPISGALFPGGSRFVVDGHSTIWDSRSGNRLAQIEGRIPVVSSASLDPRVERLVARSPSGDLRIWHRRRPEYWWGLAWLPEFWLTAVFTILLIISLLRDRRRFWQEREVEGE